MQNGETVKDTYIVNNEYVVQLSGGPGLSFDEQYKPTVDKTISKVKDGVQENTVGNSTTASSSRMPPILDSSDMSTGLKR